MNYEIRLRAYEDQRKWEHIVIYTTFEAANLAIAIERTRATVKVLYFVKEARLNEIGSTQGRYVQPPHPRRVFKDANNRAPLAILEPNYEHPHGSGVFLNGIFLPGWKNMDAALECIRKIWETLGLNMKEITP